ncbi:MAG: Xaa-Pro peptidase family protein [Alphaproteobacteria bacterium]|nr:Xaa-Pro peptidase family protein [Alphaproteobacteria bacterium]
MASFTRKIDPTKRLKADYSEDNNDRVEIGPTQLAFDEWQKAGLTPPNLPIMRAKRHERLVEQINLNGLDALLLFDPISIRYATDYPNMQLWNAHNPFRAVLITAAGYMVLWDYVDGDDAFAINPAIKEVRSCLRLFYFMGGDRAEEKADDFASEVTQIMKQHVGDGKKLGIDKIPIHAYQGLKDKGFIIKNGEAVVERTRSVKNAEEINAMRCAVYSCEQSIGGMKEVAQVGVTENDIWAELHKGNIKRGGEWIETRLMASGQRTNPWFQECGPRIIGNNEILAFDTDLIGVYGFCVDLSRTWFIGDGMPTQRQKDMFKVALEQIEYNASLLKAGMGFLELTDKALPLPEKYVAQRYSCPYHGVGLCDEWPLIPYPIDKEEVGYDGVIEAGMAICVEAYIGEVGGPDGIKLENQFIITENGAEPLSHYPYDKKLNG